MEEWAETLADAASRGKCWSRDGDAALERPRPALHPRPRPRSSRRTAPSCWPYAFPAEHWRHLRTTNPIESAFATVKLRTRVQKGAGSRQAALAMAYKLLDQAQKSWRAFNGAELVKDVLDGATFKDGKRVTDDETMETPERVAA